MQYWHSLYGLFELFYPPSASLGYMGTYSDLEGIGDGKEGTLYHSVAQKLNIGDLLTAVLPLFFFARPFARSDIADVKLGQYLFVEKNEDEDFTSALRPWSKFIQACPCI